MDDAIFIVVTINVRFPFIVRQVFTTFLQTAGNALTIGNDDFLVIGVNVRQVQVPGIVQLHKVWTCTKGQDNVTIYAYRPGQVAFKVGLGW